ncbi:protein [Scardovia inopinata]|uniref:Uncharacterized protein n=1 Tax=Scardovia inopinata F0304 TaxID=641146 RepID=W5IJJ5_SCAIO|nr:Rv3235 family protein [Scardovia inopinata]EFG27176.2 hypothetical protein HMPREF9020_00815 [Scardovia inopinata F0304]SSZ51700.1 protein [Scardovia inopinata]SSZ51723.1 protein [Scardovia inopinata]SUV50850.1 protein [Scardovia inopinata]BAR06787.1 conserved hypothetical protein [Scardovia inopinata JCM 12537]
MSITPDSSHGQDHDSSSSAGGNELTPSDDDEPHVFEFERTIGVTQQKKILFHIVRCVPSDLSRREAVRLSMISCQIACTGIDIMRGRLSPKMLSRITAPGVVERLLVTEEFMKKFADPHHFDPIDSPQTHNLPVIPRIVQTMIVNDHTCEVTVILALGASLCWANIVIAKTDERWICTMCDIG